MELNLGKPCPNNPNVGFGHGFEFWELLDENFAVGTCKFCHEKIPHIITDSISDIIETEKIAMKYVDNFLNLSLEDNNILLVLDKVLKHCVNFIDRDRKNLLCTKMYQLFSFSVITGEENEKMINDIVTSIQNGDVNDTFMDELEKFEEFNIDLLKGNLQDSIRLSR